MATNSSLRASMAPLMDAPPRSSYRSPEINGFAGDGVALCVGEGDQPARRQGVVILPYDSARSLVWADEGKGEVKGEASRRAQPFVYVGAVRIGDELVVESFPIEIDLREFGPQTFVRFKSCGEITRLA